ncbi:MAG: hypothetical protein HRU30_19765, partial [Rhodobacteraceae bacterium]|nr:hypothetical protein [Paracoccaceae bacterium]
MRTIDILADLIGDTDYPGISAFALEHQEALQELGGVSINDLRVTQLSAARIEAQAGDYTLVLSGGQ